jgi:putative metallopeptidase-like protein
LKDAPTEQAAVRILAEADERLRSRRKWKYRRHPIGRLPIESSWKTESSCTNGARIWANPWFVVQLHRLNPQYVETLRAHAIQHIVNGHHFRQAGRDGHWWNLAADQEVNAELARMGFALPPWATVPAGRRKPPAEAIYEELRRGVSLAPGGHTGQDPGRLSGVISPGIVRLDGPVQVPELRWEALAGGGGPPALPAFDEGGVSILGGSVGVADPGVDFRFVRRRDACPRCRSGLVTTKGWCGLCNLNVGARLLASVKQVNYVSVPEHAVARRLMHTIDAARNGRQQLVRITHQTDRAAAVQKLCQDLTLKGTLQGWIRGRDLTERSATGRRFAHDWPILKWSSDWREGLHGVTWVAVSRPASRELEFLERAE